MSPLPNEPLEPAAFLSRFSFASVSKFVTRGLIIQK